MWGSTEPNDNDDCCWETSPFNNGNKEFDKDYFNSIKNKICHNGKLVPEYDAAYQESNGDYRIPTSKEIEELINKTKYKWTNINGVNGYKFTNKSDNTKFIFIPAAGCRWNSPKWNEYCNDPDGTEGSLWSVSCDPDFGDHSWCLEFNKDCIDIFSVDRSVGLSIRCVKDV